MKPEQIDEEVFDSVMKWTGFIEDQFPSSTVFETVLLSSFNRMSQQQRQYILDNLGAEWYIKLATRLEKRNA